jgi:hypothetical protein
MRQIGGARWSRACVLDGNLCHRNMKRSLSWQRRECWEADADAGADAGADAIARLGGLPWSGLLGSARRGKRRQMPLR